MNKSERVSIGGYAFSVDTEAYEIIKSYLSELEKHYSSMEGCQEILDGIEDRMAELLLEKCGTDGVVSVSAVNEVIGVIGHPESIDSESDTHTSESKESAQDEDKTKKKLYRNMEDKVIAGVCSGLSSYWNIDPVPVRFIFALLTLVMIPADAAYIIPLLYAILWICMPAAKTVRQRYEMRGEDISIDGIMKSVEEGAKEMGQAARKVGAAAQEIGKSSIWGEMMVMIQKAIGIMLFLLGICGVSACAGLVIGHSLPGVSILERQLVRELAFHNAALLGVIRTPWFMAMTMVVVFLPFVALLYEGIILTFGLKRPKWNPGLITFVLWLICCVVFFVLIALSLGADNLIMI